MGLILLAFAGWCVNACASLNSYDTAINADAAAGTSPLAKLTSAATFTGANRLAFNFGANSGDVTMEFILEGNPAAIASSGYLAVGANTASNLRFEQFNNTGQLGFTQLGVADYLFSPAVPSPTLPVHIAYVWQSGSRTMKLYLNGSVAGTISGVSASFAMPAGLGWLGANSSSGEAMVGTVHRVTVYDDILADSILQRHADVYNDVTRPPVLVSFTATPATIFAPAQATLAWNVQNALAVFINGVDRSTVSNLTVSPGATTVYSLVATNSSGSVTGRVTVAVNPAPVILSFSANKYYAGAGETLALGWNASYGQQFSISPGVGDVTAQTVNGTGSVAVSFGATTPYTLTVGSAFGAATRDLTVTQVHPASHPVISEFMADNKSTLADEDGAFPDWIELYNPTTGGLSLSGYFLTDNKSQPTQWAFPNVPLGAGSNLVVFASGKNRTNPQARLHTNFQLDKGGEYLALVGPGLLIVQEFDPFPIQGADGSYGLIGGDLGLRQYMIPTPGALNNSTPPPPAPVLFSKSSGTFTASFALALTSESPGAEIRYTLDGSAPGVTNGTAYNSPLAITGTARVRAVAIGFGQSSKVTGESFIKLGPDLVNYTSTLPILVIENFGAGVIPQKGWSGTGAGIRQLPRQSAVWATFDRNSGASALTNTPQMISRIGIRGRGAFSSSWRQKPYSVEALTENDENREVSPLGIPKHADWVLYFPDPDSNKDPSLLANTFAYELSQDSGRYSVRFRWVEAFVNEDGGDLRLADRRGVYAIVEKVSRGKDRLDFQSLSADGATGNWLLGINRMDAEPENGFPAENGALSPQFFHTAGPNRIAQSPPNGQVVGDDEPQQSNGYLNFDTPSGYTINTNQRAVIELWFKQFEDVLWNNALWRDPVNGYRKYLDAVDFADYFILNTLTHNGDGLLISMFPWKGDDGKLRMGPAWDYNWSAYTISGSPTANLLWRSDQLWYERLFTDPDFMQVYIDRWWQHRRGPMSNAAMDAIIDGQVADISSAKAVLNGYATAGDFTNQVALLKTWLKTRADWIDSNYLRPPTLNQNGGNVTDGFQVSLSGAGGTIYYTTNGSDPRVSGGAVAAGALSFQFPFALAIPTLVQARIRSGTNWSGLTAAVFYTPQDLTRLVVTEIMYHPPSVGSTNGDAYQFIELKNIGNVPLYPGALTFTSGIGFTFTNGTRLAPGEFFVLARDAAAFAGKYPGRTANGIFVGNLATSGETLQLASPYGPTVFSIRWNDRAPWPIAADGHGYSIVPRNTPANSNDGGQWRASSAPGGSPGTDDPPSAIVPVLIDEALTHTVFPAVDWVELFNPTAVSADISGWFLSDDGAAPKKFRIPDGTVLPAGGRRLYTEADFNAVPAYAFSFSLNSAGDSIYLSSGDTATNLTGYSHGFSFGAAAEGVTFGRYVISTGEEQFPAQLSPSPGTANSGPSIADVVINEIHYHPRPGGDSFVEIKNRSGAPVALYDPMRPTNTWRINGIDFTFPANVTLPAGGLALVVESLPAAFRARYSVPATVPVFGPYAGSLQDSGELLELQRLDFRGTNNYAWVTLDAVRYNDRPPWPVAADGAGASLQRLNPAAYGNDPINWIGATPHIGTDFIPGGAPVISQQPASAQVLQGNSTVFSVNISGTPPFDYQWQFNGNSITGANNSMLVLSNVAYSQGGAYRVIVMGAAGSVESSNATLTVLVPANITQQPIPVDVRVRPDTSADVAPSTNASFTVAATTLNPPVTFQWRMNGTNLQASAKYSGVTGTTLIVSNVTIEDYGEYTCAVTDLAGTISSSIAVLYPLVRPTIWIHPATQSVPAFSAVPASVVLSNGFPPPYRYLWYRGSSAYATNISDSKTNFLVIPGTIVSNLSASYTVRVTNRALVTPLLANSANFTLTVLADSDLDGMPDSYEMIYSGTTNAFAPGLDADGDGMSNLAEYLAGTDPSAPNSYLRIDQTITPGVAMVNFAAISNRTYTVQYTDVLPAAGWQKLADVVSRPSNRVELFVDPAWRTNRYYRAVTPRQP